MQSLVAASHGQGRLLKTMPQEMRGHFESDRGNFDDDDDPERLLVVEAVDLHPNEHPESARTDEAQHRGCTEHRI